MPPRPPEKGVFPLDHFGECTEVRWGGRIWVWGHGAAHARNTASDHAPCVAIVGRPRSGTWLACGSTRTAPSVKTWPVPTFSAAWIGRQWHGR